jgi:sulfate adenylyltransferase subunit 1 (EFTu-like GTPase family)
MIAKPGNVPITSQDIEAMVCWFSEQPLTERSRLVVKHTTRSARAIVSRVHYRLDVNTLHREEGATLGLNDIGKITLRSAKALSFDSYRRNRQTGSFILIDETSNETVAAGMILGEPE